MGVQIKYEDQGRAKLMLESGTEVTIVRRSPNGGKDYFKTTRVYLWGTNERHAEVLAPLNKALPAPAVKGEDEANDRAYRRYNREWLRLHRADVMPVLEELVKLKLITEEHTEGLRYSRKAGCSCPCSPGFLMQSRVWAGRPVDFYITLPEELAAQAARRFEAEFAKQSGPTNEG